ncbi:hypothetical protein [Legionella antarctica]|nr:hypothetical protein [Legionella antarctica]
MEEAKKILRMGCNNELQLYVINQHNNLPYKLTLGDLDKVRSSVPERIEIVVQFEECNPFTKILDSYNLPQNVSYLDLRIEKSKYKEIVESKTPSKEAKSYITPALELMYKAIDEFWLNFDPSHPPKKEAIIEWIEKQGATQRVANAIDTLIRPEKYRSGGNK